MKLFLFALLALPAAAQDTTAVWTQFATQVSGETRYGYQDANGRTRLPAQFGSFTNALKFRHIMAVSDGKSLNQFYQLKDGRQVGRDSVYMSEDYEVACESEGMIVFRDRRRNRVGFLNAQGRAIIPAVYNAATPFYNGLAVALSGATRSCWGAGGDTLTCEHRTWKGGRQLLINQRGEVVAELPPSLPLGTLNWYSLQRNAPAPDTSTTRTLLATNGDRLTFIDYDKEFRQWFFGQFVPVVRGSSAAALGAYCFAEVTTAGRPFRGWLHGSRAAFAAKFQPILHQRLAALRPGSPGLAIFDDHLNPFIYEGPTYAQFFTDCGAAFAAKYPVFEAVLDYPAHAPQAPPNGQQHYTFLRTATGYQLLSVAL